MKRVIGTLSEMIKIVTILSNSISDSKNSKTDLTETFNINFTTYLNDKSTDGFFSEQEKFVATIETNLDKLGLEKKQDRTESLLSIMTTAGKTEKNPYHALEADPIVIFKD
jgi:hypothetical protein